MVRPFQVVYLFLIRGIYFFMCIMIVLYSCPSLPLTFKVDVVVGANEARLKERIQANK